MKQISENIYAVDCIIGQKTKRPNSVTIAVERDFIMEAVGLFEHHRKGETPKSGLLRLVLMAEYIEDETLPDRNKLNLDIEDN